MIAVRFSVNMLDTMSNRMKVGTASRVSTMRIMKASTMPPAMPEIAPYRAPITVLAMPPQNPSSSDDWPPTISPPRMSIP